MSRRTKIVAVAVIIALTPFVLIYAWWRHHYPYGWSHCCDLNLYGLLQAYATTHDGAFPSGEATPGASMSLLYRETGEERANAELLRGKTVPESVVKSILERGELLSPETCGWHYVEGLRINDDPRLALFWDKAGLDHNGGLLDDGGHIVLFVDGQREHIPGAEWDKFLEEQRKLLAERPTAIHREATIQVDHHEVEVQLRVVGNYIYGSADSSRKLIATTGSQQGGPRGLPVVPAEEVKNAEVVVEKDTARVHFVLPEREIIYDKAGFHFEPSDP